MAVDQLRMQKCPLWTVGGGVDIVIGINTIDILLRCTLIKYYKYDMILDQDD